MDQNLDSPKHIISHHKPRLAESSVDMIAGIATGIVSQFIQHPLDTIKVRFQLG